MALHFNIFRLKSHEQVNCPCCYSTHPFSIQKPSDLLLRVLGRVLVQCPSCISIVRCEDLRAHLSSGCKRDSPSDLMVADILSQPLTTPTTNTERRLASNLVRRMMVTGSKDTVQISTGGQVRKFLLPYVCTVKKQTKQKKGCALI